MATRQDRRSKWQTRVRLVVITLIVLMLGSACSELVNPPSVDRKTDRAKSPMGTSASRFHFEPKVGGVDAKTSGLTRNELENAEDHAKWLSEFSSVAVANSNADEELRALADEYELKRFGSKKVPKSLREAAAALESGRVATDSEQFVAALTNYKEGTTKLASASKRLKTEAKKAERSTGTRFTRKGAQKVGALVETETVSVAATVIEWIDGDTLVTDQGRIRLIGLDTPEMTDSCSRAVAAKEYAQVLAPAGADVLLTKPDSVRDRDKYDRLLRYVDVNSLATSPGEDAVVDVGYSLVLSGLGVARYDSRDGYQWHPRERLYRRATLPEVQSDVCRKGSGIAPLVLITDLVKDEDSDEYARKLLLTDLKLPHTRAKKSLVALVDEAKKDVEERQRRAAELADQEASVPYREPEEDTSTDEEYDGESNPSTGDGGGGSDNGYTGPRCYAPGGKTWKPC